MLIAGDSVFVYHTAGIHYLDLTRRVRYVNFHYGRSWRAASVFKLVHNEFRVQRHKPHTCTFSNLLHVVPGIQLGFGFDCDRGN